MKCPHCGMEQSEGVAFCDHCGAALGQMQPGMPSPPMPIDGALTPGTAPMPPHPASPVVDAGALLCPSCGVQTVPGAAFCDNCGQPLGQLQPDVSPSTSTPPVFYIPTEPAVVPPDVPFTSGTDRDALQTDVAGAQSAPRCPSCGKLLPPGMTFCDNCGADLTEAGAPGAPVQAAGGFQPEGRLTCAECGAALEPDSNFCDNCGAPVQRSTPQAFPSPQYAAPQMPYAAQPALAQTQVMPPEWQGMPPQQAGSAPGYTPAIQARLVVQGSQFSLPFPTGRLEWLVGRADPLEGIYPDIDLTNHGGDELGVSRRHARICLQGNQFYVIDLRSTNHTFVNQQRLLPDVPQVLHHGDEVRFGRIKLNFYLS